uniref:PiggyBac transposable element-derived protein domain-containing protein n=1 Tax=Panagrolaimus sp. PS1159 TaxID=55785 RepID=A0AC35FEM7_9BILA
MDLTIAFMKNPPSNGKSNGTEDDGMIVRDSKRAKFMSTYRHQKFSMPDSFVFYMAKNPKTCQWTIEETPYDINQTASKLWIASDLKVPPGKFISLFKKTSI